MPSFSWVCPHCRVAQFVVEGQVDEAKQDLVFADSRYLSAHLQTRAIACSNPICGDVTIIGAFLSHQKRVSMGTPAKRVEHFSVRPVTGVQPVPESVPVVIGGTILKPPRSYS